MTAYAVLKSGTETRTVIDGGAEYFVLTGAGWDIDDIIGESEADEERRVADEERDAKIKGIRATAERIAAHARALGLDANVSWSSGASTYVSVDGRLKIRVSDHHACYACDYSISPDEGDEADALAKVAALAAEGE